ncbi:MAG: dihydroorotase [Oceanicaulis sp.]
MTETLTIRRPDDWHVHLRDGEMLNLVAPYTARQFARAIVMPNLVPPVTTVKQASDYRDRIRAAVGPQSDFEPLMTAYLTDTIDAEELARGHADGVFTAAKLYPAGATTNSASGVTDVRNVYPVFERMAEVGMPLLIHGEVVSPEIDIFDREKVFIDQILSKIVETFPTLKVVLEHITTEDSVEFVKAAPANVAATITAHHLRIDRNDILVGGIRPHMYCLPVAKRARHKHALRQIITTGSEKFFLGTDTAPHERHAKESACGCAGIFSAPTALESYAQTFEEMDALDKLEGFASLHGPRFYGLPLNEGTVTLERSGLDVPDKIDEAGLDVTPFHAGERLDWRMA